MFCETCGKGKIDAVPRIDNGLPCGVHCDDCFNDMVEKCRSRSW